jgi:hypothetical protein
MMHVASARWLEHHLRKCNPEKTVVITHHAPSGNTRAEAQRAQRGSRNQIFNHGWTRINTDKTIQMGEALNWGRI